MTAPIASGWSGCRVGLAPTGKRRLARRTPTTDIQTRIDEAWADNKLSASAGFCFGTKTIMVGYLGFTQAKGERP
jgi:hypothetical protein